jgi:hypothetical protein
MNTIHDIINSELTFNFAYFEAFDANGFASSFPLERQLGSCFSFFLEGCEFFGSAFSSQGVDAGMSYFDEKKKGKESA